MMRDNFLYFYFNELGPKEFESRLFESSDIEEQLKSDDYLELVGFNYENKFDIEDAKKIVFRLYQDLYGISIITDRCICLLKQMQDGKLSYIDGCRELADIRMDGFEDVHLSFVGYSSELEDKPELLSFYQDRIEYDIEKQLKFLGGGD